MRTVKETSDSEDAERNACGEESAFRKPDRQHRQDFERREQDGF